MKKIRMLKTESIATDKGPVRLDAGQEYELPDWIADSIVGRGYATLPSEATAEIGLEEMNLAQLRKLASDQGIEGSKKLSREDLLALLAPPAPFEKLDATGGVTPPEFKAEDTK